MHSLLSHSCSSASPEQTCAIAQRLAPMLEAGDTVLLRGDIGAGKTHFARCLIQSLLQVPEDIPSPTYTLIQTYPGPAAEIWHADLYRLTEVREVIELGLVDAFTDAICLVEWPDRLGDLAPENALDLSLASAGEGDDRRLTLSWQGEGWTSRVEEALND